MLKLCGIVKKVSGTIQNFRIQSPKNLENYEIFEFLPGNAPRDT